MGASGYTMAETFPPAGGHDWYCKFAVGIDGTNLQISPAADAGYLYFAAEQYCFGRWVKIIVQPQDKYEDFNPQYQGNDPDKMSKLFVSQFGTRYLIPAEYEVYVEFSPSNADPNLNGAECN
jgi:hypothetical protein